MHLTLKHNTLECMRSNRNQVWLSASGFEKLKTETEINGTAQQPKGSFAFGFRFRLNFEFNI